MGDIILSKDTYEVVRIMDHTGKVLSEFSFNPSDVNIVDRYDDFVSGFDELEKKIIAYESDKEVDYEKNKKKLQMINEEIHKRINHLLNTDAADSIFSVMGALSPLPSGDYYLTFIVEQIAKKIQNATGERMKRIDMKIKKHTEKYHR